MSKTPPPGSNPRMVCKVCGEIFRPATQREKVTGTCDKEACWRPFEDAGEIQYVMEDLYEFKFQCLRCNTVIYTDSKGERFCEKCRKKKIRSFY